MSATLSSSAEAHSDPHWISRAAFPVVSLVFFCNQIALWAALYEGRRWVAALLILTASHLMHGMLIGFHEASHGMLRKSRRLNDLDGLLLGFGSFMSFTLYRVAHQSHHVHLAGERDEEFWPFVDPSAPRWLRILAAALELSVGLFFTPCIFLRTFLRRGSTVRSARIRRRVWLELIGIGTGWLLILAATSWLGVWRYFLCMYLAPAYIAGNLQSWRKYIEHVGMCGSTPNSATRSIVAPGLFGKFIALTLLHEPFHGVHHEHAGISHAELPNFASSLLPREADHVPPFRSYAHALLHLMKTLPDPKVGVQWRTK